ncbi:MAG: hypothetical protein ACEQSB_00760 [Undibacterium sp.]
MTDVPTIPEGFTPPIDWQARARSLEISLADLRGRAEKLAAALKPFADTYNPDTECGVDTLVRYQSVSVGQALNSGNGIFLANYSRARAALAEWEGRA